MDQNRKEELLTLWMDEALSPDDRRELEPYLVEHPELEAEREEYLRLRNELRSVLSAEVEPPYPDFFNTHLMRQIREEERQERVVERAAAAGMWGWLKPWLAPAAAAAVVASFIAGKEFGGTKENAVAVVPTAEVAPVVYSSLSTVDVRTWESPDEGVTVIVLEGLDEIPSSVDLMKTTAALEDGEPGATF
jgi:anti-sigma factor RsiW